MSYDEHLITQAGGDGEPVDRLAEIEARIPKIPESEMSNTEKDRAYLLALVRRQQAALAKVELACDAMDAGASMRSGDPRTKSFAATAVRAAIRESLEPTP